MKKSYVVKIDFTDKLTRRRHLAGDPYEHTDAERIAALKDKGVIEESEVEKKEIKAATEKKHIKKPGS